MRIKNFIKGMYDKPHFWRRFFLCLVAVIIMGFCVSWFSFINLGTDPCSVMNFAIAKKLHMTFGNWQALLNCFLFLIVIWKDSSKIGFGTLFNMILVGYSCDFMTFLRNKIWPDLPMPGMALRLLVMLVLLVIFVFVAAIYMTVDLGTAPYDAIPMIIGDSQKKVPFKAVRMIWDISITVFGFLLGGSLGIVTVLMAFTIGPVVAFVGNYVRKLVD